MAQETFRAKIDDIIKSMGESDEHIVPFRQPENKETSFADPLQKAKGFMEIYSDEAMLYKDYIIFENRQWMKLHGDDKGFKEPAKDQMHSALRAIEEKYRERTFDSQILADLILTYIQGKISASPLEILIASREYMRRTEGVAR